VLLLEGSRPRTSLTPRAMAFVPIADRARSGSPNGASGRVHRQLRQPCRHSPVRGVGPEVRASAPRGLSCRQRQTRVPGDRLHEPSPSERSFLYYRDAEWTVRASQPGCLNASSWIPPRATRYLEALATYLTPSAHNYRLRQCCRESRRAVTGSAPDGTPEDLRPLLAYSDSNRLGLPAEPVGAPFSRARDHRPRGTTELR
jgi:hypothetical protein